MIIECVKSFGFINGKHSQRELRVGDTIFTLPALMVSYGPHKTIEIEGFEDRYTSRTGPSRKTFTVEPPTATGQDVVTLTKRRFRGGVSTHRYFGDEINKKGLAFWTRDEGSLIPIRVSLKSVPKK